jgi:hypothetical protein
VSGQLHAPAALPPVSFFDRFGWTPDPIWTTWRWENSWPYRYSNSGLSVVEPIATCYAGSQFTRGSIYIYKPVTWFWHYFSLNSTCLISQSEFRNHSGLSVAWLRSIVILVYIIVHSQPCLPGTVSRASRPLCCYFTVVYIFNIQQMKCIYLVLHASQFPFVSPLFFYEFVYLANRVGSFLFLLWLY